MSVIEGVRQELVEPVAHIAAPRLGAEHLHGLGKLGQELPAGAAGHAVVLALAPDGDADKILMSLADGLAGRGTLGADGAAEGGVLNVAAGEHRAVRALKRRANRKLRRGDR